MPMYEYKCQGACGRPFDRLLKLADYQVPQECCGVRAQRVISKPFVAVDIPAYESPATGKMVEGRRARAEDLKRSGCVPFEPGMREQNARKRKEAERQEERAMEAAVDEVVTKMTTT